MVGHGWGAQGADTAPVVLPWVPDPRAPYLAVLWRRRQGKVTRAMLELPKGTFVLTGEVVF